MLTKIAHNKLVDFGTTISILCYIIVAIFKLYFANAVGSSALYADGLNSASDVISTFIILVGLYLSRKPNDSEHTYGHYRIEQIATLIAGIIMFLIGAQALLTSFEKIFIPNVQSPSLLAAIIALCSAFLIILSAALNMKIAKLTLVNASKVVAKNNISDALTAFGAFIAIIASQFSMPLIDVVASFIISVVILKTAFEIFWESTNNLIDGFDSNKINAYRDLIVKNPNIKEIKDIKGRMLGNHIVLDITITVDGNLTVNKAHQIADVIESSLNRLYNIHRTHVHIEPFIEK
ncbi:MAG: cation diffusion facilitator family transporter [Culicoidibacterales bacterium]